MTLKDNRLKDYIYRNTDSTIRSRGNSIAVKTIDFLEDNESVKATVKGSKLYDVYFYGLQTGMISSSCTCPYDWGNVCKHEVAVANEIDLFLSEKEEELKLLPLKEMKEPVKNTLVKKVKSDGVFEFKKEDIRYLEDNTLLQYTNSSILNQSRSLYIERSDFATSKLLLYVSSGYWNDILTRVEVILQDQIVKIKSTCRCYKNRLCKHQVFSLTYISKEYEHFLMNEEEIAEKKNELLKEYGFSLEDKKHENYFSFGFSEKGLVVHPKKEGIVKKMGLGDTLSRFSEKLLSPEIILKNELPYLNLKKEDPKNTKGIGLIFNFSAPDVYRSPSVYIIPVEGKLNKDRTALVSKIKEIEIDNFWYERDKYSDKEFLEQSFRLTEEYLDIINNREFLSNNYIHSQLQKLIPKLENQLIYRIKKGRYSFSKSNIEPIKLHLNSPELEFIVSEEEDFFVTEAYIIINDKKQKLRIAKLGDNFLFVIKKENYYLNKSVHFSQVLSYFKEHPIIRTEKKDFDNFYDKILTPLLDKYKVTFKYLKKKQRKVAEKHLKKQVYLSESENFIILKPIIEYENQKIPLLGENRIVKSKEDKSATLLKITHQFEEEFESEIRELHPSFLNQQTDFFYLDQEEFVKDIWFINTFEVFKEHDIEVFGFKNLNLKYNQHKPSISINVSSDIDWFDVNIEVAFGEQIVSLKDLKKNIINNDKYIRLKDDTIGILPEEWMKKYTHLFRSGEVKKNSIGVSKYQFSVVDTLYEELENESNLFDEHLAIKQKIKNFDKIEDIPKIRGVKATLRPYQKEGLKWLNFLDDFNLGGCLADDMGLGKTLQVISFLKYLKTKHKYKKTNLIIVPTSLIFNWKEEVLKFCPTLKVKVLTGIKRQKNTEDFDKFDLILTTYGIVINDITYLKEYEFNYIILDESQAIKNPTSKRFKTVRLLKAKNRLVLTGTPIENNTFDLYAQMTFVNPGLLGGINHFKNEYATAIDKDKNKEVAMELKALIDPFLLRRTKEQVATELPPKTEQFLYCTMGVEQRKIYEAYKNKYKNYLLGKIAEDGLGKSKMHVLEGLTKLRQICDSPSLLKEEDFVEESIKADELVRHITEKTNNHKILIFSQFVQMLSLVKNRLDKLNIRYEYLDGKTKNRQKKVDNFQNNKDIRVFLISLKAGGTGLNLTAADYVYIVDPWWNPAVEAQAIDRCYRIGQKKNVTAFKMICKDTIEEKIVIHQQNKKQVSDDLIQIEESYVKSLSKESITDLFS